VVEESVLRRARASHLAAVDDAGPERYDRHEAGFFRYGRIVRFVRAVLREASHPDPVPVVLTCGAAEENVHNNRVMARALAGQGYDAALHEVGGGHDFGAWGDALDPWLTGLLARLWAP